MSHFKRDLLLRISKATNFFLITVPFAACWYGYYSNVLWLEPFFFKGNLAIVALFFLLYVIFSRIYESTYISIYRVSELILSQALAFLLADGVMYVIICILKRGLAVLWPGIACIIGQILISTIWVWLMNKVYFIINPPKKAVVVYEVRDGLAEMIKESDVHRKFDLKKSIYVGTCLNDFTVLEGIETVFLSGIHSVERNKILKYCVLNDIETYVIPRIGDVILSGAKPMHMFHLPILRVRKASPHAEYVIVKRLLDILFSMLGILLLWPFMMAAALAIKLYDGGPVLYKQTRLTKDGKEFQILKFRSMVTNAEADGVARLSTGRNDCRITPVGKVLRTTRFDEIPQLFNILEGSLSIVGPRPERPEIAAEYEKDLPEFRLRLQVKAGLTGYAQVYGKYNTEPYDKLQMDLMYIANIGLIEDIRIFFATIKTLFSKESTEGVDEGKTTAEK